MEITESVIQEEIKKIIEEQNKIHSCLSTLPANLTAKGLEKKTLDDLREIMAKLQPTNVEEVDFFNHTKLIKAVIDRFKLLKSTFSENKKKLKEYNIILSQSASSSSLTTPQNIELRGEQSLVQLEESREIRSFQRIMNPQQQLHNPPNPGMIIEQHVPVDVAAQVREYRERQRNPGLQSPPKAPFRGVAEAMRICQVDKTTEEYFKHYLKDLSQINCPFCGGKGHLPNNCASKKNTDRTMRESGHVEGWAAYKNHILSRKYKQYREAHNIFMHNN